MAFADIEMTVTKDSMTQILAAKQAAENLDESFRKAAHAVIVMNQDMMALTKILKDFELKIEAH